MGWIHETTKIQHHQNWFPFLSFHFNHLNNRFYSSRIECIGQYVMAGASLLCYVNVNDCKVCVCVYFLSSLKVWNLPEPAHPTVAAPAPMNLAAESMSRVTAVVWNDRTCGRRATGVVFWAANVWLWLITALLNGRKNDPLIYKCNKREEKRKGFGDPKAKKNQ